MNVIKHQAHARAGLIGNPTDGYGGKTISFTMRNFSATVVVYPWERLEILWSDQDRNRFSSLDELVNDVNLNGLYGGVRLVKATIKRFAEYCRERAVRLHDQPFSIRYETNIPRGVGLAGSSAIVVATLECLLEYYDVEIPRPVLPSLARSVENDELGIACGYQDRAAQVYGGLLYMDFSEMPTIEGFPCGDYESMDPAGLPPVYVAYDLSASKTSSSVHGPLRTRMHENADLAATMRQIADLVSPAREAIESGDARRLHELLNRNFDLRSKLYDIHPQHRKMVQTARNTGASAKFAGSGGAIVGTYADDRMLENLKTALAAENEHWKVILPAIEKRGLEPFSGQDT